MGEYDVEIHKLSKMFSNLEVVKAIDLYIRTGEFMVLLGPSGCGKTTTLRCIGGLERPDGGEIFLGGVLISSVEKQVFVPPNKRNLGMVFQSYAVWPHMTVFENVSYPLRVKKYPKKEMAQRVREVLALMGIGAFEKTNVTKLSGGQQQRVALARSIVAHPKIILLDEPLSNLDAILRKQMRFELKKIQRKVGVTFVYVTHNQDEAMGMGDRIAVMEGGRIHQVGTPLDIYGKPQNPFVAEFVGRKTILSGVVKESGGSTAVLETDHQLLVKFSNLSEVRSGSQASVFIAPGSINVHLTEPQETRGNVWKGDLTNLQHLGDLMELEIAIQNHRFLAITKPNGDFREGETVYAEVDPKEVSFIGMG
jgi:iron(III) transport system ATP-binding protein